MDTVKYMFQYSQNSVSAYIFFRPFGEQGGASSDFGNYFLNNELTKKILKQKL